MYNMISNMSLWRNTFLLLAVIRFRYATGVPVDKVQLDPTSRQFVSTADGRTVIFHGLAQENNGAPNELVNITNSQMNFMRKVR